MGVLTMHPNKLENVLNLGPNERFSYFVRKLVDRQEVIGLFDDSKGWATKADDAGKPFTMFWPEREFAERYRQEEFGSYSIKPIDLASFVDKWIPGMKRDGIGIAAFPTPGGTA